MSMIPTRFSSVNKPLSFPSPVVITGAKGMLGSDLSEALKKLLPAT